jgi:hypothetical protein
MVEARRQRQAAASQWKDAPERGLRHKHVDLLPVPFGRKPGGAGAIARDAGAEVASMS